MPLIRPRARRIIQPAIYGAASGGGGGGAAYTFTNSAFNTGGVGNVWTDTTSFNIGPAAASRLVIVCLAVQNNPTLTVQVNSVFLTQAVVSTSSAQASLWYGTVPSGSGAATIVVTGGNFLLETMLVYYATGLVSNTPRANTTGNTISVNSGDFLFTMLSSASTTVSWAGSTQTPAAPQSNAGAGGVCNGFTADWTIASTGSFSITQNGASGALAAANWR